MWRIVLVISLLIWWRYQWRLVIVSGKSMQPTLLSGDVLLTVRPRKIKRYDLVVFKQKNKLYIKRVIGLPNETVQLKTPYTLINHMALKESYLAADEMNQYRKKINQKVPPDTYFVMGDNRKSSVDSRILGVIEEEKVLAKVVCRVGRKSEGLKYDKSNTF